ncbi:hypothetical protein niasHS_009628 [Heterodera schachtii]|uniref:14-3-3 domain-containing protein n=2 Tax=Heterodera TaxID=34509 RepID=A0ABD2JEA4_HETSC
MVNDSKEDLLFFARVCEKARRYDDMTEAMQKMIQADANLNSEERELLVAAYKGAISARRASWRSLCYAEQRVALDLTDQQIQVAEEYRTKMESELLSICHDILGAINEMLLPKASDAEAKAFYLKMKGDYYRYMIEVAPGEERPAVMDLSKHSYQDGLEIATKEMKASNPTRLGLAHNFAVFHFEVLKLPAEARQIAQKALDEAMAEIGANEVAGETDTVLHVIREALNAWKPKDFAADA